MKVSQDRAQRDTPPHDDLHPDPHYQPYGAHHQRGQTNRKHLRQWSYATAPEPSIPAELTLNRHLRSPYKRPPSLCIDASSASNLASEGDLPGVCLTAAANALFSVYQDWVHQNTGIHLDKVIDKDGKWQERRKKLVCLTTQCYDVYSGWVKNFSRLLRWILTAYKVRS